jgi:hypothetical protein
MKLMNRAPGVLDGDLKKNQVIKVNDFETAVRPPTLKYNLKFMIDTTYTNMYIGL